MRLKRCWQENNLVIWFRKAVIRRTIREVEYFEMVSAYEHVGMPLPELEQLYELMEDEDVVTRYDIKYIRAAIFYRLMNKSDLENPNRIYQALQKWKLV